MFTQKEHWWNRSEQFEVHPKDKMFITFKITLLKKLLIIVLWLFVWSYIICYILRILHKMLTDQLNLHNPSWPLNIAKPVTIHYPTWPCSHLYEFWILSIPCKGLDSVFSCGQAAFAPNVGHNVLYSPQVLATLLFSCLHIHSLSHVNSKC